MESYPPTPVTRYGIELLKEGIEPLITYISPDGIVFYLNGGLAPWPGVTEGVVLAEGAEGLHPMFTHLDHKGARQDGATWADTVFDPAEINFEVIATATTPENLRKVIRKWVAAWDPERPGILSWVTPDSGEWWCHVRLFRAPADRLERTYARSKQQRFKWSIRNDDAFWRSHDSVSQFRFSYNQVRDLFNREDPTTLGASWAQEYSTTSAGTCGTDGSRAVWTPEGSSECEVVNRWLGVNEVQTVEVNGEPDKWTLTFDGQTTADITHPASAATVETALKNLSNIGASDVSVAGDSGGPYTVTFVGDLAKQNVPLMSGAITEGGTNPYVTVAKTVDGAAATTATDTQVVRVKLGASYQTPFPSNAHFDIWGRRDDDDESPTGIRARIGRTITLSRFNAGTETVMYTRSLLLPPLRDEEWTLECGTPTNDRHFKILRGSFPVVSFKETGTDSALGDDYRGGGFGMHAGDGDGTQTVPPTIEEFSMGDNVESTQSGHLTLTNFGDQEGWPDILVYGPGTFKFGNGPDTEPTIEFGPLADGQVALIKTHPGQRAVYDLTADHSEQDLPFFQSFLKSLINFAFNNNVPPLLNWFQSLFGIDPPQGNMYSLLKGRWTKGVPPRSASELPTPSQIAVEVTGGNADTKVVAALTPLRRWPE